MEEKAGNEIAADDEEDKYARAAIEDGQPNERDVVVDAKPLKGMESDHKKDRQGAQSIETRNARHRLSSCRDGIWHKRRPLQMIII